MPDDVKWISCVWAFTMSATACLAASTAALHCKCAAECVVRKRSNYQGTRMTGMVQQMRKEHTTHTNTTHSSSICMTG